MECLNTNLLIKIVMNVVGSLEVLQENISLSPKLHLVKMTSISSQTIASLKSLVPLQICKLYQHFYWCRTFSNNNNRERFIMYLKITDIIQV